METKPVKQSFRQLTPDEINKLFNLKLESARNKPYVDWAKKYFPPNVTSILVGVNSEYNDETYDNSISYIICYDKSKNEVSPLKGKEIEARKAYSNFYIENNHGNGATDCMEDFVVYVNVDSMELFVKGV